MRIRHPDLADRNNARGVTLIESVCAITLLALYIGGACRLALATRMITDEARERYQAISVARNRIERIRTRPFDQFELFEENAVRVNHSGAATPKGRFRRTTEIMSVNADVKEIRVRVAVLNRLTVAFDREPEKVTSCIARFQLDPPDPDA